MGHLFVVQADLTKLVADHIIIPTDAVQNVHEGFLGAIDEEFKDADPRFGLSPPNAFQIRPMVELDYPPRWASSARDQCVPLAGVDSNVATTTSSTCAAVTVAGRPAEAEVPWILGHSNPA